MSKLKLFVLVALYSNLTFGLWGKHKAPEHCSGQVYYNNKKQELSEIKIGLGHKNIIAYLKPDNNNQSLIEYEFNLKETNAIKVVKISPLIHKSRKYIHIEIFSNKSSEPVQCIINSDKRLVGKYAKTGATVKFPFDTIDKVEIDACKLEEEVTQEEAKKLLTNLKSFVTSLDTITDLEKLKSEAKELFKKTEKTPNKE